MLLLRQSCYALLRFFRSPTLLLYALPWLMGLLVLGTVAQRYIGLYASQKLFFGSFVLWAGLIPLPGAYSVLSLIALGLMAKLLYRPSFARQYWGTLISHASILMLLAGGMVSALGREDGYMVLDDGQESSTVMDYRDMALQVEKGQDTLARLPLTKLQAGHWPNAALPFQIQVLRYCYPCAARPRREQGGERQGVAARIDLTQVPAKPEEALNLHGAEVSIRGAGRADGTYIVFDGLAAPETVTVDGISYVLSVNAAERRLPFSLRLVHFTKADYPGTGEARAYRSDLIVRDGAMAWSAATEMNNPLRYRGYTVYQSSFIAKEDGGLQTVLTVVKNSGRWFPYLAITLLCAGLLLHILMRLSARLSQ